MSYDTKSIIKDVNGKPVPQYWNREIQQYEVFEGSNGKLKVNMVDVNGAQIQSQDLIDQIKLKLDELTNAVDREKLNLLDGLISDLQTLTSEFETYVLAENARVTNEVERVNLYNQMIALKVEIESAITSAKLATTNANIVTTNANSKIVDVENRFQTLTTAQQQASEVVDARKGKPSLKAKIDELESQSNDIVSDLASYKSKNENYEEIKFPFNDGIVSSDATSVFSKKGNVVSVNVVCKKTDGTSFEQNNDISIGVIPVGYRPGRQVATLAGLAENAWAMNTVGSVFVKNTTGEVILNSRVNGTSKFAYIYCTYIV